MGRALSQAWDRMILVGFKPFDLGKWFTLGLAMFLAGLWTMVFHMGLNLVQWIPGLILKPSANQPGSFFNYIHAHGQSIALGAIVLTLALLVVYALVTFFACRGQFMMVQSLAENEAKIVEPWSRWARQANSVFGLKILTSIGALVLLALTITIGLWIVWPDIQRGILSDRTVWTVTIGLCWLMVLGLVWWNVLIVTDDFIVPMMYAQPMDAWSAWGIWLRRFLANQVWAIMLFYLMRLVLLMGIGAVTSTVTCLTLCTAAIPYISSVVFMPLVALDRCFAYYFVEQFGPQWAVFRRDSQSLTCTACGYDLRGNPEASTCPECGTPVPWTVQDAG